MKNKLPFIDGPRELCILRLSALGDVTHTVPVIRSIQAHWPDTRISWIIGKLEHRLLENLQGVNFIPFDKRGGLAAIGDLRRRLNGQKFDVLMHMQVALRANIISRLVDSPIRLGWDRGRSRDRHHWFTNHSILSVPFQHQVPGFLEFAQALGIPVSDPKWDLPVSDADRVWAIQHLPDDRPILMISPCSSHVLRNWRNEHYAMVADHAAIDLGMQVVLIGGPSEFERSAGSEIESAMSSKAVNLIGKDTLRQSMALMEKATVLLAPDAGPIHIASALGTRVLGLYAATWSKRSGPYNSLEFCVDRYAEAARKFRNKEPEQVRWGHRIEEPGVMDLIEPQSVIEMLEKIMKDRPYE
jgi:heptosyltransferase I